MLVVKAVIFFSHIAPVLWSFQWHSINECRQSDSLNNLISVVYL